MFFKNLFFSLNIIFLWILFFSENIEAALWSPTFSFQRAAYVQLWEQSSPWRESPSSSRGWGLGKAPWRAIGPVLFNLQICIWSCRFLHYLYITYYLLDIYLNRVQIDSLLTLTLCYVIIFVNYSLDVPNILHYILHYKLKNIEFINMCFSPNHIKINTQFLK